LKGNKRGCSNYFFHQYHLTGQFLELYYQHNHNNNKIKLNSCSACLLLLTGVSNWIVVPSKLSTAKYSCCFLRKVDEIAQFTPRPERYLKSDITLAI